MAKHDEPVKEVIEEVADELARVQETSLSEELRALGKHLAQALAAAGRTPEAEAVKADLREGLRTLRTEVDTALGSQPGSSIRTKAAGVGPDKMRTELAGLLRTFNTGLERMAATLDTAADEARDAVAGEDDTAAG
jgi:hypothetical protein